MADIVMFGELMVAEVVIPPPKLPPSNSVLVLIAYCSIPSFEVFLEQLKL